MPSLTCLHTGDTGGVKHPLPLSRTQRDLVCQQVYLTQRPTQQIDKTVEQRQLNVSVQQSKAMHLCLYFSHTTCFSFFVLFFVFFCNKSNVCLCNTLHRAHLREFAEKSAVSYSNAERHPIHLISPQEQLAVCSLWALDRTISFVYTALSARK